MNHPHATPAANTRSHFLGTERSPSRTDSLRAESESSNKSPRKSPVLWTSSAAASPSTPPVSVAGSYSCTTSLVIPFATPAKKSENSADPSDGSETPPATTERSALRSTLRSTLPADIPPHVRKNAGFASPPRRDRTMVLAVLQNPESARLSGGMRSFNCSLVRYPLIDSCADQPRLTQKTLEPRSVAAPNPPPRHPHHPLNSQLQQRRERTMQRAARRLFAVSDGSVQLLLAFPSWLSRDYRIRRTFDSAAVTPCVPLATPESCTAALCSPVGSYVRTPIILSLPTGSAVLCGRVEILAQ